MYPNIGYGVMKDRSVTSAMPIQSFYPFFSDFAMLLCLFAGLHKQSGNSIFNSDRKRIDYLKSAQDRTVHTNHVKCTGTQKPQKSVEIL